MPDENLDGIGERFQDGLPYTTGGDFDDGDLGGAVFAAFLVVLVLSLAIYYFVI